MMMMMTLLLLTMIETAAVEVMEGYVIFVREWLSLGDTTVRDEVPRWKDDIGANRSYILISSIKINSIPNNRRMAGDYWYISQPYIYFDGLLFVFYCFFFF